MVQFFLPHSVVRITSRVINKVMIESQLTDHESAVCIINQVESSVTSRQRSC